MSKKKKRPPKHVTIEWVCVGIDTTPEEQKELNGQKKYFAIRLAEKNDEGAVVRWLTPNIAPSEMVGLLAQGEAAVGACIRANTPLIQVAKSLPN